MTRLRHPPRPTGPDSGASADAAPSLDDPRAVRAVQEYFAELEAVRRPDLAEFLGRHPAIAAALAECLDALEFVHAAARSLHAGGAPPDAGLSPALPLGDFRL